MVLKNPSDILLDVNCSKRMGKQDMTGKMVRRANYTGRTMKLGIVCAAVAALVMISAPSVHAAFFEMAGKSARVMGMSEVFLASAGDASSYWYNPAGLAKYENRQVGLTYGVPAATISDLNISQINFVTPLGSSSGLGFGVSYGGIDVANEMVISGGYGLALNDRFSLGGNVKIMRWAVEGQPIRGGGGVDEDLSKVSFSLDLSAAYGLGNMFGLGEFTTGVYVKDPIMTNISESGDDGGKLPLEAGLGLMFQRGAVLAEGDVAYRDGNTIFKAGGEFRVPDSGLSVRAGLLYGSNFDEELERFDVNLGLGYNFGAVQFNYALALPFEMQDTSGKHFVSFGVSF